MVKNINQFFDEIFCINLKERTDRYKETLEEFNKHQITAKRVEGINGKLLNIKHKKPGALGLLYTHIKLLQHAKDNNLKNILIFEDDIKFIDNFQEFFSDKIDSLPDDWDLLYLGGNNDLNNGIFTPITGDLNFKPTPENYKELDHELFKTTNTRTTHAVAINEKAYDFIIDNFNKNYHYPIDRILVLLQIRLKSYTFLPSLVKQRPSFSDIEGVNLDYDKIIGANF